jgi:DNA modification methylase
MTLSQIITGDCRQVMRSRLAEPDSIDAIITDPPYGLGFMGKAWDRGVPGVEFWAEMLRVAKPGAHLLAFGGTRTHHRMMCAIEDAGWELRDTIMWVYGCLTADAEILTEHGWKNGLDVHRGERVAQWDHADGSISLARVQETFRAPWDGPMRVLRNTDTDQVLTPNHRVYHQPRQRKMSAGTRTCWYEPEWKVAEAADLSTWNPVRLPLAGIHDGPGIGGDDYAALLGWVWTEGGFDLVGTGVRVYQSSVNADKVGEIDGLMGRLGPHGRYNQPRIYTRRNGKEHPYTAVTWYFSGELAERVRADLPGKRPTYDLLWRMTASEKHAMLHAALLGDGGRQRNHRNGASDVWQFYQKHEADLIWVQTLLALIGKAGKVGMRTNRPGGAVYLRDTSTTELQARHLRDTWEDYTGEVWCVRVPTGAFVARRNGKVFITGNSGFPKSHNLGDGRGTALKPAWEPIIMARKPLVGTVAATVKRYGTGVLNIDLCRIGDESTQRARTDDDFGLVNDDGWKPKPGINGSTSGRWPANLIHDGSEEVLAAFPDAKPATSRTPSNAKGVTGFTGGNNPTIYRDEMISAARFFYCAKASRKDRDEGLDGFEHAKVHGPSGDDRCWDIPGSKSLPRANFHPTVKPTELMRYLCRLVTPPGGTILDPFCGSGSTGKAAVMEWCNFIGIDLEDEYTAIAERRVAHAQNQIRTELFGEAA